MPQLHFIFLFFITIKLCFALYYYLRLAIYRLPLRDNQNKADSISISAIICYHNESENISHSVDALFNQSCNKLEIVLVDDLSSDNTYDQLIKFSGHNSIVVQNHTPNFGKKLALTKGINTATQKWLLLTDADCIVPKDWAKTMASYTENHKIVLGYAPLNKSKTLAGKFARYETFYTALQYLSFALAGRPYMGVGRNLMYHRSIFDVANGFSTHNDIASGDDDLLINYTANRENTAICIDPDSFVYSLGKETFSSFIRQKTRHISSSHKYRWLDKVLLGVSSIAQIGLYMSAFFLLFLPSNLWLMALLAYWALMLIIQYPICKKLHSMDLWLLFPVYDIAMAIYYIIMIPFVFIKKQNSWS